MLNTSVRASQFIVKRCLSAAASPPAPSILNKKVIFKKAYVDKENNSFVIKLDNNYLKSPAGNVLLLHSELLALLISNEWNNLNKNGLGGSSKSTMHLTGLAFTALDNPFKQTINSLIERIVESIDLDTLLYFSGIQTSIADEQQKQWLPIIHWINSNFQLNLHPTNSLIELPKISKNCKERLKQFFSSYNFPALCGINYGTENLKSLILTIALLENYLNVENVVEATCLEQIIQSKVWGTFEWFHHLEQLELKTRISAAMLFVHLNKY